MRNLLPTIRLVALLALLVPAAAFAQSAPVLRLEMRVSRPQVGIGSAMPVTIRMFPGSAAAREVLGRRGFEPVRLVVSRGGSALPDLTTTSLSSELGRLRVSRVRTTSGGALELDTDLAYWALFDRPGRYEVVVEFAPGTLNPADSAFAPVTSPSISVTVQPRRAAEITKHVGEIAKRLAAASGPARAEQVRALGASRSSAALPALVGELHGADESLRWAPAALGLLSDRTATLEAVRQALATKGPSAPIVEVLLQAGDRAVGLAEAARAGLASEDAARRRHAADAIAVLTRHASTDERVSLLGTLLPLQSDPDPVIRLAVVYGIELMDEARALTALEAAGRDTAATVRAAAVRALRDRRARLPLTALLLAPTSDTLEVARALAGIPEPEAKRTLSQCLAARTLPMRLACAEALWEVGDHSGRGVLLQALHTRDDTLRAEVIDWITVATGRAEAATGIPELSLAWTRWLQQVR